MPNKLIPLFLGLLFFSSVYAAPNYIGVPETFTHNFVVENTTRLDGTAMINHTCSASLGKQGVFAAGTSTTIAGYILTAYCKSAIRSACKVEIHMTPDCSGPIISSGLISSGAGMTDLTPAIEGYVLALSENGFKLTVAGGPAF